MSILKRAYEISVWKDEFVDGELKEKQLGIIGSDKMTAQCRAIEPNLVRNVNGTKKFSFKMYKRYIDTITGEEVENPFADWLVAERKVKLYYKKKWYDFIIKDTIENSADYLYTYQLEDALVQELAKNGFSVTLDTKLMNNTGSSRELAEAVLKETDWKVAEDSDVAVEKINEALVYVKLGDLSNYKVYHITDQDETTRGIDFVEVTGQDKDDLSSSLALAFYSSCQNKPHRFQFIWQDDGYNRNKDGSYEISRKDDRTIDAKDCQYFIEVKDPSEYKYYNSDYGIYLPEGFSIDATAQSEGVDQGHDTVISNWYRGDRYGFAQQAKYIPLLDRYCQKFHRSETLSLTEKNLRASYSSSDDILSYSIGDNGVITGIKNGEYCGLELLLDYTNTETYIVSYYIQLIQEDNLCPILEYIGGHNSSFETNFELYRYIDGEYQFIDKTSDDRLEIPKDYQTGSQFYIVASYTKKIGAVENSNPHIYIQPNRGIVTTEPIGFEIRDLTVKVEGDYYGYTDAKYISPTLVRNCITNPEFKGTDGWKASANSKSDGKPEIEAVYGRFTKDGFKTIAEEYVDGTYSTGNSYKSYLKVTFANANQFVLNSSIFDNRTFIENMPEGDEWRAEWKILTAEGQSFSGGFSAALDEYYYSSGSGLYELKSGNISFSVVGYPEDQGEEPHWYTFKVQTSSYTKKTFKKNSKIYLKLQPFRSYVDASGTTYYIESASLYKVSKDESGQIIKPDSETDANISNYLDKSVLEKTYNYFNCTHVEGDSRDDYSEADDLPLTVKKELTYDIFVPVYNDGAQKIRTITAKESNYFNILQQIAEANEQWLTLEVERNENTGEVTEKKVAFRNYSGGNNYACFRYGVNLKDIQRTSASKNIVTKLIVKDGVNQHADGGFCTIQRAGSNPTKENYIYDFQYHQNMGLMDTEEYIETNYYLTDAAGPDGKLWAKGEVIEESLENTTINGYFPRVNKINKAIEPIDRELEGLRADLVQQRGKLEIATSTYDAALSGLEETRDDFRGLTGIYPESIQQSQSFTIGTCSVSAHEGWFNATVEKTDDENKTVTIKVEATHQQISKQVICTKPERVQDSYDNYYFSPADKKPEYEGLRLEIPGGFKQNVTYELTYELIVESDNFQNIGCHNEGFKYFNFSVVGINSTTGDVVTYNDGSQSFPKGRYTVVITGTFTGGDSSDDNYLWIQPNRGLTEATVCTIDRIAITALDEQKTSNIDRRAFVSLSVQIGLTDQNIVTIPYNNLICTIPAGETEDTITQVVQIVDLMSDDAKNYIEQYGELLITESESLLEKSDLKDKIDAKEKAIADLEQRRKDLLEWKRKLNQLFYMRYSRFIQEGTWTSNEYVDDDKYYIDAQSVLYNSCYPQVTYAINVLALSQLEGYELFEFDIGEKTYACDEKFFGNDKKEEVIISEMSEMLDDASKDTMKVQNFKKQFQDLFQKITATVQQTQYNSGSYEQGTTFLASTAAQKSEFLTKAINDANAFLDPAHTHSVTWQGGDGITVTDDKNPINQIRLVGGAILLSTEHPITKEKAWRTAITGKGISADLLTAGQLDVGKIQIMAGNTPSFRWDARGITAYDANWDKELGTVYGINTKKFVRFDKFGVYGIDGTQQETDGATWVPTGIGYENDANKEIDAKATFALTWEGLKVTGNEGVVARIGKLGDSIFNISDNSENIMNISNNGVATIGGFHIGPIGDNEYSYDAKKEITHIGLQAKGIDGAGSSESSSRASILLHKTLVNDYGAIAGFSETYITESSVAVIEDSFSTVIECEGITIEEKDDFGVPLSTGIYGTDYAQIGQIIINGGKSPHLVLKQSGVDQLRLWAEEEVRDDGDRYFVVYIGTVDNYFSLGEISI